VTDGRALAVLAPEPAGAVQACCQRHQTCAAVLRRHAVRALLTPEPAGRQTDRIIVNSILNRVRAWTACG
jgi:hypothetical protein